MIEVTNEMLALLREYQMGAYGEMDDDCDKRMIAALIELHEANKPKPEPFRHIDINGILTPVYVEPPTREPLSADELSKIVFNLDRPLTTLEFARVIEQAHGIGVTND